MIGDRKFDIEGAEGAGIDSIGVLYGYGSKEELEQAGAKLFAQTPAHISKLII
jgi:phosphoglycolate phosphatase